MIHTQTIHINFTGGIVPPGYLKTILEIARAAKVLQVRFGLRQQLMMDVPIKEFPTFEKECNDNNIAFYVGKEALPNIMSSYPATGIFTTETWLREGAYKDIFNLFDYKPVLKVNIADSTQNLVPFFTGHINWISSGAAHFWHLYIRFPKTQILYSFPDLIYTNDIALVSKHVENVLLQKSGDTDGNNLYKQVKSGVSYLSRSSDSQLILPPFSLPYYEGFNKHDNTYWLGVYRRNEIFPISFLTDVCSVCMETRIGQLYTTPWKSIIIKGIESTQKPIWDYVLGKYRINVRHAANELNWQVEDNNEEGLLLKRHIIRHFDKEDVRTYGLCFAVQTQPHSGMFGCVSIKKEDVKNPGKLKSLERYQIVYSRNFNPNSFEIISFRKRVEKEYLGPYLVSLCKLFYEQQSGVHSLPPPSSDPIGVHEPKEPANKIVHQCKFCFTVYDEVAGDTEHGVAEGTAFEDLPLSYCCPLCEAGKEAFKTIAESSLHLQGV